LSFFTTAEVKIYLPFKVRRDTIVKCGLDESSPYKELYRKSVGVGFIRPEKTWSVNLQAYIQSS
jgi:hypothetical protein